MGSILYYISSNNVVSVDSAGTINRHHAAKYATPKKTCLLPLSDTEFYIGTVKGCYRNAKMLPYLQDAQINDIDTINGQLLWATNAGVFIIESGKNDNKLLRRIISIPCSALKHDALFTYLHCYDDLVIIKNSTLKPVAHFSSRNYVIPFRLDAFYVDGSYIALAGNRGVFYIPRQHLVQKCTVRVPKIHILSSLNGKAPADSVYSCRYRRGLAVSLSLDILDYKKEKHVISCRITRDGKEWYRQADLTEQDPLILHPAGPGLYRAEYHVWSAGCSTERVISYTLRVIPLWYQQWWALPLFMLAAIAAGSYALYGLYLRKAKKDQRKLQQKLHLRELEAQSLLGQLKPHFIFNILTPLQGFFMRGEKVRGLDYLDNFSRLMRGMLNAIRDKYAPLATEITFIKHYLEVQQERFGHCFSYHITIDPLLDAAHCIIPTLLLQPLVENAVEHGIIKTNKDGHISVIIKDEGATIVITVKDNGRGLPQNFALQQNHALMIITERVQLLKMIKGKGHFSIYNNGAGEPGVTSLLILTKDNQV